METSGNDECLDFLNDCLKVVSPLRGAYINIGYYDLPKTVLGRVTAEIEITRTKRTTGLFKRHVVTTVRRKIRNKEFYIKINRLFLKIENENFREEIIKSIIIHELLHIERKDLIETSKNYRKRKHKKIHSSLEREALSRLNALRRIEGLPELSRKNYIEKEISRLISK